MGADGWPNDLPAKGIYLGPADVLVEKVDPYVKNSVYQRWDPLRKYNLILAVIHIVIAIALTIYFARIRAKNDKVNYVNLDILTHAFNFVNPTQNQGNFFQFVSEKVASLDEKGVATLVVSFFAITAGFHLLYAFNPCNIYLDAVNRGNNYLRWIEYGISATIMIVIIALLSGVKDVGNYVLLIVSSLAIMSTGQWFETATGKSKWLPIIVGFVVMGGVFLTIFSSFRKRLMEAKDAGFTVPTWLYAVVFVMFGFYASFGFVPIAQMIFKRNYRRYEYTYLTLSLASKATLGLLVAFGFGQRSQADNPS